MTWQLTATGATFDLCRADPASISLLDIAQSLATTNRYNGAALRPNSVAEHSLLVVEIMQRDLAISDAATLLAGLMHDAHETYIGDLTSPLKAAMARLGMDWHGFEASIQRQVLQRFMLHEPWLEAGALIKTADLIARATERRDLLPPGGPDWIELSGVSAAGWIDLRQRDDGKRASPVVVALHTEVGEAAADQSNYQVLEQQRHAHVGHLGRHHKCQCGDHPPFVDPQVGEEAP